MHLISITIVAATILGTSIAAPLAQDCNPVICGANGYDKDQGNLFYDDSGNFANYQACSAQCDDSADCQSFAYGGTECITFNITLTNNFTPVLSSKYVFYDRVCESMPSTKRDSTRTDESDNTATSTSPVTIPATCTGIAPQVTLKMFKWFNSTHNLDCANPNFPSGSQVCWNADTNTLCNEGETDCTCTPFCYTGLPSAAYQPLGYGPPDTISVEISGAEGTKSSCSAANAQSTRNFEIGEGHFDCNSAADIVGFHANSNPGESKKATLYFNDFPNYCGFSMPQYTGTFEISCSYDAGQNATCTIDKPVVLPLTGWA